LAEAYVPGGGKVADPLSELLRVAAEIRDFKDFVAARVAELRAESWRYESGQGAEQLRAEVALYERALDRTAKVLTDITKLGLEERQVRLAERHAALLQGVLTRVFARLELTERQRELIPVVVPEELRRAGAEDVR